MLGSTETLKNNMTLEQQVCSLELAKRLKELGVKQESYFNWCTNGWMSSDPKCKWIIVQRQEFQNGYAAFTVAELGEMLPYRVVAPSGQPYFPSYTTKNGDGKWLVSYHQLLPSIIADTEADARAKMLIYLIENKLVTV